MNKVLAMKSPTGYEGLYFNCPGCGEGHAVRTKLGNNEPEAAPVWEFNGDLASPTVSPSILVQGNKYDPEIKEGRPFVCHSFVRGGRIEFLSDCTHKLAGQTVELETFE